MSWNILQSPSSKGTFSDWYNSVLTPEWNKLLSLLYIQMIGEVKNCYFINDSKPSSCKDIMQFLVNYKPALEILRALEKWYHGKISMY